MAVDTLSQRILNFIKRHGNTCETGKIFHDLRLPRKTVNQHLYSLQRDGAVVKIQDKPPMWQVNSYNTTGRGRSHGTRGRGSGRGRGRGTRGRVPRGRGRAPHSRSVQEVLGHETIKKSVVDFLLTNQKPTPVWQIAEAIRLQPSDVNSVLYALERSGQVNKFPGAPPLWSLTNGNGAGNEDQFTEYLGDGGGYSGMLSPRDASQVYMKTQTETSANHFEIESNIEKTRIGNQAIKQPSDIGAHTDSTVFSRPSFGNPQAVDNCGVGMDAHLNSRMQGTGSIGASSAQITDKDEDVDDLTKVLRVIHNSTSLRMLKRWVISSKTKLPDPVLDEVLNKAINLKYLSEKEGVYVLEDKGEKYFSSTLSLDRPVSNTGPTATFPSTITPTTGTFTSNSLVSMPTLTTCNTLCPAPTFPINTSVRPSLLTVGSLQGVRPIPTTQPFTPRGRGMFRPNIDTSVPPPVFAAGGNFTRPPPPPLDLVEKKFRGTDLSDQSMDVDPSYSFPSKEEAEDRKNFSASSFNLSSDNSHSAVGNLSIHHTSSTAQVFSSLPTIGMQSMTSSASYPAMSSLPLAGPSSLPIQGSQSWSDIGASVLDLELTKESLSAVSKNPVSAFMEFAQSRHQEARIEVINQSGPSHKPRFVMAAFLGERKLAEVTCSNKKDGRKEVADKAIRTLVVSGKFNTQTTLSAVPKAIPSAQMTHFDRVAALTHQHFNKLMASIAENFAGRKVIAGLVMQTSEEDVGTVIAVGSGNRCITGEQMSLEGNTVNDSHAEIITRRGFIRFLYKKLMLLEPNKPDGFFEKSSTSNKLKIRDGIKFHLYISTAPCGDGALFSPRDAASNNAPLETLQDRTHHPTFTSQAQGLLRTKMEGGEGTIPVESDFTGQSFDGIQRGERLRTMSCTDKICRWNVVGMQGALLSHFLEPIYLDSLTLGFLFDPGHLARAVCCRVSHGDQAIDNELPPTFRLNHPWLGRVTAVEPSRETQKTKALSINWCLGDEKPEVTDGTKGLCYTGIEKGFFSRCTKKNMYNSFKDLCTKFNRQDLLAAKTYHEAKNMATDFVQAKNVMLKKFKENGCGIWVSKPMEEELFC